MTSRPRISLVYSINDPAGFGSAKKLLDLAGYEKIDCPPPAIECFMLNTGNVIAGYGEETIYFDWLDKSPDPEADLVIVLSKHSAVSGKPSLTTHHTGNPTSDNSYGGDPFRLSISAPPLSKALLKTYMENADQLGLLDKYEVTLEATHHGPTNNKKPLVFIEIGSTIENWKDEKAREAMALTVLNVLENGFDINCKIAAGFGETHYPKKFTQLHLESEYCFGHIIPKYAFNIGVSEETIVQAVLNTWPSPAKYGIIRKKSIKSAHRNLVIEVLSELDSVEVIVL